MVLHFRVFLGDVGYFYVIACSWPCQKAFWGLLIIFGGLLKQIPGLLLGEYHGFKLSVAEICLNWVNVFI